MSRDFAVASALGLDLITSKRLPPRVPDQLVDLAENDPDFFQSVYPGLLSDELLLERLGPKHPFRERRRQQVVSECAADFRLCAAALSAAVSNMVRQKAQRQQALVRQLFAAAQSDLPPTAPGLPHDAQLITRWFNMDKGLFERVLAYYG
mmetsp:Transcript_64205/g.147834  ORF Transcript_64205/g.147834 Transcript_64205/m.147834 type:complete len:150 (+) Transcript_64205:71-520(+)